MRHVVRPRRKRRQVSEINVVPYIDVMLVLLVIFMITAPLLRTGVEIDLPDANATPIPGETQDPLILSVASNGDWYLNVGETQD
nr:biopolymer transporter ExbD [Gammaproteobacteria bacterium]